MSGITAGAVRELRERTGVGMMDCKKALAETNGDVEAAVDWLRKKGHATATKKAGRAASEGLVGICAQGNKAAIIEVNAETDFVGRNATFQDYVKVAAEAAMKFDSIEDLKKAAFPGEDKSFEEQLTNLIATIGENMSLRRLATLSVENGVVANYIHTQIAPNQGRIGVILGLESTGDAEKLQDLGKQICMHIAATAPKACHIEDMDPEIVARERQVLVDQAKDSGKPEAVINQMIEGRMKKFYQESVLTEQLFIMDGERRVSQVIADAEKEVGAPVKLTTFVRYNLGEGVEKKEENFAAEVAATMGQ